MRLIKFQIEDYKSITSNAPCWLANDITILAGKNESGKTTILEALNDFEKTCDSLDEETLSLESIEKEPTLELWFEPTDELWNTIFEDIGINPTSECEEYKNKNGIPLVRGFDGSYSFGDEFEDLLDETTSSKRNEILTEIQHQLETLKSGHASFSELADIKDSSSFSNFNKEVKSILSPPIGNEEMPSTETVSEEALSLINDIKSKFSDYTHIYYYRSIRTKLIEEIPRFVFFSSFEQQIPYEIPLNEIENHKAVMDFIKVAGIDLEKLKSTTKEQTRSNLLRGKSADISGNFSKYWDQDNIELSARVSGDNFIICIKEDDKDIEFMPTQRSRGFQWYLSFYLRLKAESVFDANRDTIILIDEPGLYLHATAQQDVLKVLESLSQSNIQTIFSTHSPYLLDTKRLDRIRLVTRNKKNGTTISNKIHVGADRDSLTPIITALGLDISKELTLVGRKNVLLEGISDYYFLHGMAQYLKIEGTIKNITFIPSKGASQMHLLASIFIGWEQDFIAIVDNDKAGQGAIKNLKNLNISENKILVTSNKKGYEIEDLFCASDFKKYIIKDKSEVSETKNNSQIVKDDADKVILAKCFMDNIRVDQSIKLSNETTSNFLELFKRVTEAFENNNDASHVTNEGQKQSA